MGCMCAKNNKEDSEKHINSSDANVNDVQHGVINNGIVQDEPVLQVKQEERLYELRVPDHERHYEVIVSDPHTQNGFIDEETGISVKKKTTPSELDKVRSQYGELVIELKQEFSDDNPKKLKRKTTRRDAEEALAEFDQSVSAFDVQDAALN